MKAKSYFYLILLFCTTFSLASCSKDDNGDDNTAQEDTPKNQAEAQEKIQGKWELSGSGDIQSVEFINDNTYILQISANSNLLFANYKKGTIQKSASIRQPQAVVPTAQSTSTAPTFVTGAYTISADGKTITLDQVATISIQNLSGNNFSFSITFHDGDKKVEVSLSSTPSIDATSKTSLLAKTWVLQTWPNFYDSALIGLLTQAGYTPKNLLNMTFTPSGTFIDKGLSINTAMDPNGIETTTFSSYQEIGTWRWKDSQQNTVIITIIDEEAGQSTGEVILHRLTSTELEINLGDAGRTTLSPQHTK